LRKDNGDSISTCPLKYSGKKGRDYLFSTSTGDNEYLYCFLPILLEVRYIKSRPIGRGLRHLGGWIWRYKERPASSLRILRDEIEEDM